MKVEPVSRVTLTDSVVQQIRRQILDGTLGAGERILSERELCYAFAVGRTTVREALQALIATGLIERSDRSGGLVVARLTSPDGVFNSDLLAARTSIKQVFDTRKLLEIPFASMAAERATDADLNSLLEILTQMDRADEKTFTECDRRFHVRIAEATGNEVMGELYRTVADLFFRTPRFYPLYQNPSNKRLLQQTIASAKRDHWSIFDAMRQHDPEQTADRMAHHLESVRRHLARLK